MTPANPDLLPVVAGHPLSMTFADAQRAILAGAYALRPLRLELQKGEPTVKISEGVSADDASNDASSPVPLYDALMSSPLREAVRKGLTFTFDLNGAVLIWVPEMRLHLGSQRTPVTELVGQMLSRHLPLEWMTLERHVSLKTSSSSTLTYEARALCINEASGLVELTLPGTVNLSTSTLLFHPIHAKAVDASRAADGQ